MDCVVLTGATSMLGMALIEECIRQRTHVLAIVRPGSSKIASLPSSEFVRIAECSLSEYDRFPDLPDKYDVFYHFAWQGTDRKGRYDPSVQQENIKYALDAVTLAARLGCRSFVGAGSQAEYGRAMTKLSPTSRAAPESAYGIAKYAASKQTLLLAKHLGMTHIWARVFSVYGPYDGPDTMVMSGIRQLLDGGRPKYTKGGQLWDYLYSDDAARAFYLMGEKTRHDAVYCLGSGTARPLREYIETMRDAVDPALPIGLGEIDYPENQVMFLCADIRSLSEDTGFSPQTDFRTGIAKTIKWVRERF
jgi:nucleoside-diphosphate-sugar epimerase